MNREQAGIYRELLDAAWMEADCLLPNDDEVLRKLAGATDDEWLRCRATVLAWFDASDDGKTLCNVTLQQEYRIAQEKRKNQRKAGRKGGLKSGKKRRSRAKQAFDFASSKNEANGKPPSPSLSPSTQLPTEASYSADADSTALALAVPVWSKDATDLWREAYGGDPDGSMYKALKPISTEWARYRTVFRYYLAETEPQFVNVFKFVATIGAWEERLEHGTPIRAKPTMNERSMEVVRKLAGGE